MLVSAIMLLFVAAFLVVLYNTNGFVRVIRMYFLAISANIIIGTIYLSKAEQAPLKFNLEYKIYYMLSGIRVPFGTVVRLFNLSICFFIIAAVLYIRYLYRMNWFKTALMMIPGLFLCFTIDPDVSLRLYFASFAGTVYGGYFRQLLYDAVINVNKIILTAYIIVPIICAVQRMTRTIIFVRRKDIVLSGIVVALINAFAYFALFGGVFKNIMFYSVNSAKLPLNPQSGHTMFMPHLLLWITVLVLVGIIVIFRPFRVMEKSMYYERTFPWNKRHDKDMSMVLHTYKNAFLGVLQQFTLVQNYIETGAYDRALNNAGIGKNIAAQYMEMLNKTLGLLGKPGIKFAHTDLVRCIDKAMQRVTLPSDGSVKMDFTTDIVDVYVYGDERHLTEMFVNVLLNAAEALEKKDGSDARINIALFCEEDLAQITVRDNGIGVEHKDIHKIFKPFFTTKSSSAGGVGLSYVRNVVRRHHGEIRVKSEPGVYTEFQIVLPVEYNERKMHYVGEN